MGEVHKGIYYFKNMAHVAVVQSKNLPQLWHHHLGHPSTSVLVKFPLNVQIPSLCNFYSFDVHHRAKDIRAPFSLSSNKASFPFELIHYDLWGKCNTSSITSAHYFLCIVDDYSRAT